MTATKLLCPRSSIPLTRLRIGGVDVDVCEDCGGLWLDRLEIATFERPESVLGDALLAHLQQYPVSLVDRSARTTCPLHPEVVMMRRPFSQSVPVVVDECPQCGGLWLDADELTQVRAARARVAGGIAPRRR